MKNSIKNAVHYGLKTIVVLGFVCSTFACEDSVSPKNGKRINDVKGIESGKDTPRP
jgi:hypothetical protein